MTNKLDNKWTTIILTKDQKEKLKLVLRKLGLLNYKELFNLIIQEKLKD